MKKPWQQMMQIALVGLGVAAFSLSIQPVSSQEASPEPQPAVHETPADAQAMPASGQETPVSMEGSSRKTVYLFSPDFPRADGLNFTPEAIKETRFWQLLDREMRANGNLRLTENMEEADYRVELRCGGAFSCSTLMVDVKDMNRDVLASFTLKHFAPVAGLGPIKWQSLAHDLTHRLDERLRLLDQGGYGHTY